MLSHIVIYRGSIICYSDHLSKIGANCEREREKDSGERNMTIERECICEREREKDRGERKTTIERECICEREREKDRGERNSQFNSIQFHLFPAHINISYSNDNMYIMCRKRGGQKTVLMNVRPLTITSKL